MGHIGYGYITIDRKNLFDTKIQRSLNLPALEVGDIPALTNYRVSTPYIVANRY